MSNMTYQIYHKTEYHYQDIVTFSHNIARLQPRENEAQKLIEFSLEKDPESFEESLFVDQFGNTNTHLLIRKPHRTLTIIAHSTIDISPEILGAKIAHIQSSSSTYQEALSALSVFSRDTIQAKQFLFPSDRIPKASQSIRAYALESFAPSRDLFEAGVEFMGRIYDDFKFLPGFSDVTTPTQEIFEAKQGVCQDFAQLAIAALRAIGLPARYMSGYIETLPPKGKEKLFGADASHAWYSLFIPGAGWISFDPTNNLIPKEQHILLGYGRDYQDIAPLKGVLLGSGESKLSVMVDVRRVDLKSQDSQS